MSREEYYILHRERRIASRKSRPQLNAYSITTALKEVYLFQLSQKDEAIYRLIRKYESSVSERLKIMRRDLSAKGDTQGKEFFGSLVYSKNPLIELFPKSTFSGSFLPAPLRYSNGY